MSLPATTSADSTKSDVIDIGKVVDVVLTHNLLKKQIVPRYHHTFPDISLNPLDKLDRKKMISWIQDKINEFGKYKGAFRLRDIEDELSEVDIDSD